MFFNNCACLCLNLSMDFNRVSIIREIMEKSGNFVKISPNQGTLRFCLLNVAKKSPNRRYRSQDQNRIGSFLAESRRDYVHSNPFLKQRNTFTKAKSKISGSLIFVSFSLPSVRGFCSLMQFIGVWAIYSHASEDSLVRTSLLMLVTQ